MDFILTETHGARAGIGHPPLERHPLVVGSVSVGVGPQENPPDVCHVVHAYRRAFKDVTAEKEGEKRG